MTFKGNPYIETPAQEQQRLAACPAGSTNRTLATLPVNVIGSLQDKLIELPHELTDGRDIVVVPFEDRGPGPGRDEEVPRRRHDGWWGCIVVASNHPVYPAGGWRLGIPEAELVRGRLIDPLG